MRAAVLRARPGLALRGALGRLSLSPRVRRWLLLTAVAGVALGCLYLFWFRDSGLVKVERASVTGLTTQDAPRIRAALVSAAGTMTTLHLHVDRLEQAVGRFPVVRTLKVSPDFPHALRIEVVEQRPVAMATSGGLHVPVAGDGSVLRGLPVRGALPRLQLERALPPEHVRGAAELRVLRVLAAAPRPLLRRVRDVGREGGRGLVVHLRHGPDLVFGDVSRLRQKWIAVARVLADSASKGATYLDVRLPERPAAGGLPAQTVVPPAPVGPAATPQGGQAAAPPTPQSAPATASPAPPAPAAGGATRPQP